MKFVKTIVAVFLVATMLLSAFNIVAFAENAGSEYKADVKILNANEHTECKVTVNQDGL